MKVSKINELILAKKHDPSFKENNISDGYHTFEELYEFQKHYNAALFNEWAKDYWKNKGVFTPEDVTKSRYLKHKVHKSIRHHDGELCFGGGWFIVVAILPTGQIANHYKMKDWDLFQIPEVDKAKFEFDGHTPQDVLDRLAALNNPKISSVQ